MENKKIEKKLYVRDLITGQQVRDVFVVSRVSLAETKAGKAYLALRLMDRTGDIEARLWDNAEHFAPLAAQGAFVQVTAVVKSFREQLQLGVASLGPVNADQIDLEKFFPASKRDPKEMRRELKQHITGMADVGLRKLLSTIFQGEVLEQFLRAPAAKKMHHAYLGGLAEHTLSVTGLAVQTAQQYPILDRDMLVAGSLLHDLAKIKEFDFGTLPCTYTDQGRLLGHLVLGVEMVREAAASIPELHPERVDQLSHIILSHHGQLEFGSPVLPMTPEAVLLHHLDDVDAKMNYMERLRNKMKEPGWQWTDYQRPLERFLYLNATNSAEAGRVKQGTVPEENGGQVGQGSLTSQGSRQRQQSLF